MFEKITLTITRKDLEQLIRDRVGQEFGGQRRVENITIENNGDIKVVIQKTAASSGIWDR